MLILKTQFLHAANAAFSQKMAFYDFFMCFLYTNFKIAFLPRDTVQMYFHKHMWLQIKMSDTLDPIIYTM